MNINFCFEMNGGKTVAADVQSAHFDGVGFVGAATRSTGRPPVLILQ